MRPWPHVLCRFGLAATLCLGPAPALADYDDALRAYVRGEDAAALRELRPLVAQGSPSAQYLLGLMREAGRGGPKNPAEAAALFRKAAEGGNAEAMAALGVLSLRGEGVARNDAQAGDWLRKAAERGSARGLYLLGLMRLEGRGGPAADAPGYLRRAVKAGSGEAAATLGEMLLAGREVARDPAEAYRLALAGLADPKTEAAVRKRLATLAEAAQKELDPTVALSIAGKTPGGKAGSPTPGPQAQAPGRMVTGTGFVVSRLGHVLTNAHVAGNCGRIEAVLDGVRVGASLTRSDQANDLALLRLAVAPPRALVFREGGDLPAGQAVFAAGYPGQAAVTGRIRITPGRTRDLAEGAGPAGGQAVSAEVLPGNSGGPLLDAAGHVAGVVRARRDTEAVRAKAGDAPADMGFVVPLTVVKAFLSRGQVPLTTAPAGRVLDQAMIGDVVAGTVVPLFCLPAGR